MNDVWDFKDHVVQVSILLDLSVKRCSDALRTWDKFGFDPWSQWAKSVKALGASPLAIFLL